MPLVKDGPDNDYWDHVDFIVDEANRRAIPRGVYYALFAAWGVLMYKLWAWLYRRSDEPTHGEDAKAGLQR